MEKYKVWLYIECANEEEEYYEDVGHPSEVSQAFDTLQEAQRFKNMLLNYAARNNK